MEMLAEKKMLELKHIEAIKKEYNNKMKEAIEIVTKLKLEQQKREGRREAQCKRKLMPPFMRKLERRRYGQSSKNSTTPTSPENTSTSPDSPQTVSFNCVFNLIIYDIRFEDSYKSTFVRSAECLVAPRISNNGDPNSS